MYNILVVAHYNLANCLVDTVKGITGFGTGGIYSCGLDLNEAPVEFSKRLQGQARAIYKQKPLLVFVDLFGGTPCNTVISQLCKEFPNIHVIAGVNLPMLLEAYLYRDSMSIEQILAKMETSPKRTVVHVY